MGCNGRWWLAWKWVWVGRAWKCGLYNGLGLRGECLILCWGECNLGRVELIKFGLVNARAGL